MSLDVCIGSVAMAPVTKRSECDLPSLVVQTASRCMAGHDPARIDAIFVGNMLGGRSSSQRLLGSLVAERLGCERAEAYRVEAACGSGGSAIRSAFLALRSGEVKNAIVIGVEIMSTIDKQDIARELATASDWQTEGGKGASFISLNALLMQEYIARYGTRAEDFSVFSLNAHDNATTAEHALFRQRVSEQDYLQSRLLTPQLRLMDASPVCDGCAALYLTTEAAVIGRSRTPPVRIRSSASASQQVALARRDDLLGMPAIRDSTRKALMLGGMTLAAIDFYELHDAYSIMAALSLEAAGFTPPGTAIGFARDEGIGRDGRVPICTMGGLKARGHAVGATGVYQAAEAYLQLAQQAGANQVADARVGMVQNIGGCGSSVTTHILERMN